MPRRARPGDRRSAPRRPVARRAQRPARAAAGQRLTYVSCHPAALARDLRHAARQVYRIESFAFFDLFPQTGHMEVVVQMVRAEEEAKGEGVEVIQDLPPEDSPSEVAGEEP